MFLIGLNLMRESLSKISNDKLRKIITKATNSNFKALLTGIITTILIQSSSGVTAITVAFICAGLLSFTQGVMILVGANIGTTFTAFIFTLNLENYALVIIAISYFFQIFKNNKIKLIAKSFIGLGILFQGLAFMNEAIDNFSKSQDFVNIVLFISKNNLLSIFGGTLISALIQSSSATIALTQTLYASNLINLKSSIAIMLGANIGTTIASLITSIGSTQIAKKTLHINILFNLIGGVVFLILITPFANFLVYLEQFEAIIANKKITIAYSHMLYNIISSIIFYFIYSYILRKRFENKLTQLC